MLPRAVLRRVHDEILDYHGIGTSIIEVSHKGPVFREVLDTATGLFRELSGLPDDYHVLFVHGGARMQFSAVPLNLIARSPERVSCYVETGFFARQARQEAARYGTATIVASRRAAPLEMLTGRRCAPFIAASANLRVPS